MKTNALPRIHASWDTLDEPAVVTLTGSALTRRMDAEQCTDEPCMNPAHYTWLA